MSYDWLLALRYLRSKKSASISVGTLFAILGVALGVAALATVMSVTGGFQKQFRDKVLGVNAHVLILKRTPEFHEYKRVMDEVSKVPGVVAVAPFVINPMLVTAGDRTATGVLMKGVDPQLMGQVLDLPKQIVDPVSGKALGFAQGDALLRAGLRRPGAHPPDRKGGTFGLHPLDAMPIPSSSGSGGPLGVLPIVPAGSGSTAAAGSASGDWLHQHMEKRLEDLKAENATTAKEEAVAAAAPSGSAAPAPAPSGEIEPEGGYSSKLPDEADESQQLDEIAKKEAMKEADKDLPGVVIGRTLAKNLAVGIGDRVRITSPAIGFSFTGSTRAPTARQFKVIAIFEAGFDQYDSKLVYTDIYEAQAFWDQGDSVTGVEMRVADIDKARKIRDQIEKQLANGVYHVMDWEELNHPLFTALKVQQIGMSAVLALIIVVAAFTVIATLVMVVLDKRKEIAVLKAMGARDGAILRTFLYQGLIIGMIGTCIGLLLGFAVCKGLLVYGFPLDPKVYFISRLPVEVRPQEFLVTGAIAILICLAATIVPALHAANIRPAEGLRAQ